MSTAPHKEEGKSATQIENEHRQAMLAKEITVRCMDCPDLEWTGPAREAREQWAIHRRNEHDDETAMASVLRMDRELTLRDLRTPANGHKLTREFVIAAVKRYVREHGRAPRSLDWQGSREKRGDYPSYAAVVRVFPEGWRAMLEAADVDPVPPAEPASSGFPPGNEASKHEESHDWHPEEGAPVDERTCKRDGCDEPPLDRGGLYAGLCSEHKRAAQADRRAVRRTGVYWQPRKILDAIREWADEHEGEPPSMSDWRKAGDTHPHADTVADTFGTWSAAIAAAGFPPYRSDAAPDGTISALGSAVDVLAARRRTMLAEIDEIEAELREAVEALRAALTAHELEEAA